MVEQPPNERVSTFIQRLIAMLNSDDLFPQTCSFNEAGDGFLILNMDRFSNQVLPHFTKSTSYMSFVRQLNHYEFRKTRCRTDVKINHSAVVEFKHQYFHRDRPDQYHLVVRRQWSQSKGNRDVQTIGLDLGVFRCSTGQLHHSSDHVGYFSLAIVCCYLLSFFFLKSI